MPKLRRSTIEESQYYIELDSKTKCISQKWVVILCWRDNSHCETNLEKDTIENFVILGNINPEHVLNEMDTLIPRSAELSKWLEPSDGLMQPNPCYLYGI